MSVCVVLRMCVPPFFHYTHAAAPHSCGAGVVIVSFGGKGGARRAMQ